MAEVNLYITNKGFSYVGQDGPIHKYEKPANQLDYEFGFTFDEEYRATNITWSEHLGNLHEILSELKSMGFTSVGEPFMDEYGSRTFAAFDHTGRNLIVSLTFRKEHNDVIIVLGAKNPNAPIEPNHVETLFQGTKKFCHITERMTFAKAVTIIGDSISIKDIDENGKAYSHHYGFIKGAKLYTKEEIISEELKNSDYEVIDEFISDRFFFRDGKLYESHIEYMECAKEENDPIFDSAEIVPEPPGGMAQFMQWVVKNYRYPKAAIDAKATGTMQIAVVVERDGMLSDIRILKDLNYGTGDAAIEVLKNSPKWRPAIQNGRPVRFRYTIPIKLDQNDN